ncbi:DUF1071 domain-containing protein [Gammaproteobacteria bacterium]
MSIEALLKRDVNSHTEKKNNLTYLSWAWAWAEALKADPKATFVVNMFDGKCYMDINGTGMVWVTVTMFDKPMTCQLPVMDYRNKPIPNPDAFAVNTAIMRCMTKALSLHGLGLYIYAGEDLPEEGKSVVITPTQGAMDNIPIEELRYLDELAIDLIAMCEQGDPKSAWEKLEGENLDAEQKIALWTLLPSKVRSALKKAKEL